MWCYTRILAHYPYVVITAVLVVSITCLIVSLTVGNKLTFEEPMAGFEPRRTAISDRLVAYHNLVNDARLTRLPRDMAMVLQDVDNHLVYLDTLDTLDNGTVTHLRYRRSRQRRRQRRHFFCDVPDVRWSKVVFHSTVQDDLFTAENIRNMCQLENKYITSNVIYQRNCLRGVDPSKCCRTMSLGNYIALLTNKESCSNITQVDVEYVRDLIQFCVGFYHNFSLTDSCDIRHSPYGETYRECKHIPKKCQRYNAIYNIMHYISDNAFHRSSKGLRYALSFFPVSFQSSSAETLHDAVDLYLDIEQRVDRVGNVEIVAADFGIKDSLFHHYLTHDTKWLICSSVVIFLTVWAFTGSIFVTFMTFLSMFWALELSYFLYVFVFEITFFPYMNLVTVLLVIAIGADDVFVYMKIWQLAKKERNNGTLEKLVADTLKHATWSMFVTSLTTAGALFANVVSPITSIECFSIYAGTAMLCNLLLMVTWTPAAIVVQEKWCNCCYFTSPKVYKKIRSVYRSIFEKHLPNCLFRLRYVWIILFGGLGVLSGVLVFCYPKLKLPTSFRFQVFRNSHLMEMYDQDLREHFWFEKAVKENMPLMPITIVWGALAKDNGNKLNPYLKGNLEFDFRFDMASPSAQQWLQHFCQQLRETDFYQKVSSIEYTNCFIEHFILFMKNTPCRNHLDVCCSRSTFPYTFHVFNTCIKQYIPLLMKQNSYMWDKNTPGIRFYGNAIRSLIVQFSSNVTYSYDFIEIGKFYEKVNSWVSDQMLTAPSEMSSGWFVSEFKYYSIQKGLAEGMPQALGISIAVATIVAFFTSLNVLITLYAIVTIACIMLVTIASIVLLGWELNILESVIITVAVGLAVDHTLHYSVAYRLAPDLDRENRALCSVVRVGNVIFVAALSTFLAGMFMLPSVTLVYQKFGIFLIIVISISWLYSTLFFQSILLVIGPQGGFGQFHWPTLDCCSLSPHSHIDRTIYTMSESTMSSSSSGYPHHGSIDTSATEHEFLSDSHSANLPCRRHRGSRHYAQPRSQSASPDSHQRRKLLNGDDGMGVEIQPAEKQEQKLSTDV